MTSILIIEGIVETADSEKSEVMKPAKVPLQLQPAASLSRVFSRIVRGSTALGLGCMAAAIESLRSDAAGFSFQVSLGTVAAFAAGAAVGLFYWKMASRSRLAAVGGAALLVLAGLAGFLYPLRFVPANKIAPIAIGLLLATCLILIWAFLLWRMNRFFVADDATMNPKKDTSGTSNFPDDR
jgi:hypothetical protein